MLTRLVLIAGLALSGAGLAQDPAAPAEEAAQPPPQTSAPLPRVAMETSQGRIVVELRPDKAPDSVDNFLNYVRAGFYDGTIFHRVIENFMIQGGGYTADLQQKPVRAPIRNEANNGLSNLRGTVAMARTNNPDSASSQFFFNVVDNPRLDFVSEQNGYTWGYAVFGQVVEGMDVLDKIRAVETGPQGPFAKDVPKQPVVIQKVEVIEAAAAAE
ncbi:MAG TPA: peptidylprolyl isomerase [Xanthomonadaceae bacterium]|nr:peptidylprolyl isomerase [Xanthomonadaceae bacterium]